MIKKFTLLILLMLIITQGIVFAKAKENTAMSKNREVIKQTAGRDILGKFAPEVTRFNDVVGGKSYYQEWGKEVQKLEEGDVVNIPANVKHWHGAQKDSYFSHIAVEVDGVETSNEWLEPVTDEVYDKL